MLEVRLGAIKDRIADLEFRLEAFQSINVEMLRLLVEVSLSPAQKSTLLSLLQQWSTEMDLIAANSKDASGAELQKMFIAYFEEKIGRSKGGIQ